MKKLRILIALLVTGAFLVGCSTVPDTTRVGSVSPDAEPDYAVLVLSELEDEETAAFVGGLSQALDTQKIIPALPDDLANTIKDNPGTLDWLDEVMGVVGGAFEFNRLVVAMPDIEMQEISLIGIPIREQEAIMTTAYAHNLDTNESEVEITHWETGYTEDGGAGVASSAGRNLGQEISEPTE